MKQKIIDNVLIPIASWAIDHFMGTLFLIFGFVAMSLLSYGLYGVNGWESVKFIWIVAAVVGGLFGLGYLNTVLYTKAERATTEDWILLAMLGK